MRSKSDLFPHSEPTQEMPENIELLLQETDSVLKDSKPSDIIPKPFLRKEQTLYKQVFKNDGVQHLYVS